MAGKWADKAACPLREPSQERQRQGHQTGSLLGVSERVAEMSERRRPWQERVKEK